MARQRILLVEDEPSLAELITRYLTRLGYSVDACGRAQTAWERFTAASAHYDLVIVDLTLPDLDGETLLLSMLEQAPSIAALVSSAAAAPATLAGDRRVRFLQKPFLPRMLAESVEQALRGQAGVSRPSEAPTPE
jgi:DNA-binding response OmpR family regulator